MRPALVAVVLVLGAFTRASWGLGQPAFVTTNAGPEAFCLVAGGKAAPLLLSPTEYPGVARATRDLAQDLGKVSGMMPLLDNPTGAALREAGLGTDVFPPLGTALTNGDVAFRQHEGGHTDAPN